MKRNQLTTSAEAARMKGVSKQAISKALKAGRLNGEKAGGSYLVFLDSTFDAYEPRRAASAEGEA